MPPNGVTAGVADITIYRRRLTISSNCPKVPRTRSPYRTPIALVFSRPYGQISQPNRKVLFGLDFRSAAYRGSRPPGSPEMAYGKISQPNQKALFGLDLRILAHARFHRGRTSEMAIDGAPDFRRRTFDSKDQWSNNWASPEFPSAEQSKIQFAPRVQARLNTFTIRLPDHAQAVRLGLLVFGRHALVAPLRRPDASRTAVVSATSAGSRWLNRLCTRALTSTTPFASGRGGSPHRSIRITEEARSIHRRSRRK